MLILNVMNRRWIERFTLPSDVRSADILTLQSSSSNSCLNHYNFSLRLCRYRFFDGMTIFQVRSESRLKFMTTSFFERIFSNQGALERGNSWHTFQARIFEKKSEIFCGMYSHDWRVCDDFLALISISDFKLVNLIVNMENVSSEIVLAREIRSITDKNVKWSYWSYLSITWSSDNWSLTAGEMGF